MNRLKSISIRRGRRQKGSFLLEFALIAPLLLLLLAGTFEIGMTLNRAITTAEVCRNANVLVVRGIDLSQASNQKLLMKTATGLGMADSSYNPLSTGNGVVILTTVTMVGPLACAAGISGYNGNTSTCPNYGYYVISSRITIGNTSVGSSVTGNPSSTLASNGSVTAADIASNTGDRATGFPGIIALTADQYTYVAETYVDISSLQLFSIVNPPLLYMRNLS